jgi:hypothetical protein
MRPRTTVPLLVLPLLLLGLALAPEASARKGQAGSFPVSLTIVDPCTGEEVAVEGEVHFVGGDHFRTTLTGVGASGVTYEIHTIDNEGLGGAASDRSAYTSTSAYTLRFVRDGAGGGDDFTTHSIVHSTMNANGEWTVEFHVPVGSAECS